MTPAEKEHVNNLMGAVRELLDAMDRQYGAPLFSHAVEVAQARLREFAPRVQDVRDRSRERATG